MLSSTEAWVLEAIKNNYRTVNDILEFFDENMINKPSKEWIRRILRHFEKEGLIRKYNNPENFSSIKCEVLNL